MSAGTVTSPVWFDAWELQGDQGGHLRLASDPGVGAIVDFRGRQVQLRPVLTLRTTELGDIRLREPAAVTETSRRGRHAVIMLKHRSDSVFGVTAEAEFLFCKGHGLWALTLRVVSRLFLTVEEVRLDLDSVAGPEDDVFTLEGRTADLRRGTHTCFGRSRALMVSRPDCSLVLACPPHFNARAGLRVDDGSVRAKLLDCEVPRTSVLPFLPDKPHVFRLLGEFSAAAPVRAAGDWMAYTRGDVFPKVADHLCCLPHLHSHDERPDGHPHVAELADKTVRAGGDALLFTEHDCYITARECEDWPAYLRDAATYSQQTGRLILPGIELATTAEWRSRAEALQGHACYLAPEPELRFCTPSRDGVPVPADSAIHHPDLVQHAREIRAQNGIFWYAHPAYLDPEHLVRHWTVDMDLLEISATEVYTKTPSSLAFEARPYASVTDRLDTLNSRGFQVRLISGNDYHLDSPYAGLYETTLATYVRARPGVAEIIAALRAGNSFVTTGEIVCHGSRSGGGRLDLDLEWTFPLRRIMLFAEGRTGPIVTGLHDTEPMGRGTLRVDVPGPQGRWLRAEVEDVAGNLCLLQPVFYTERHK